ncbi:PEP-CTERM sorting domain-containing protein [Tunturiibacter lichenicola]|uniref:PEP-CTERM sorting domain-containing protein n=1 Tax=Tunturiibacter lichenicola TaxID=2051959 RepID=UPI003D9AC99A
MRVHSTLTTIFALVLVTTSAYADSLVYIVNGSQQFGTLNLATGVFQQIGSTQPEAGSFGLATAPNGSLVTFAYSSNLYSINPATGAPTLVGPTGLDNCATSTSPCGSTSASTLGNSAGKIYATDFQNSLYNVNAVTGVATLIGPTGIPGIPYVPGSFNADGTINFYDQAIFGAAGNLYETFDAFVFDLNSFTVVKTIVAPALYQIDPSSGLGTLVGTTDLGIGAVAGVDGTYYAFNDMTGQIEGLNLANGSTNFISNFDPAAGVIQGAVPVPTPEPSSLALFGTGLLGLVAFARNKLARKY